MATETFAAGVGELRASSTSNGGTALTTTRTTIPILPGTKHLYLTAHNLNGAYVAAFQKNPSLVIFVTTDNLNTATDYSQVAQDGSATTEVVLSGLSTAANGDYVFVGAHIPFGGVRVDMSADSNEVNGTTSTLTVKYWSGATNGWTDATATDNTSSSSKTFAQDGEVTWAIPADWTKASLREIGTPAPGSGVLHRDLQLYWTRWEVNAAIDALVCADEMHALSRSSVYSELINNQSMEFKVTTGPGGDGCIEAKTIAGTGNLIVQCATGAGSIFP